MTDIEQRVAAPTRTAHILYLMHAISPFTLWTLSLIALIIGAVTRDHVRGTWVETHYAWLLRTCVWGLVWLVAGSTLLILSIVGILLLWPMWFVLTVWYLYRVIRGWLRLNEGQPAPS